MIQDMDFDSNVDTDEILSLLAEWDAEDCMDTPSTFNMRESYALKTQSYDLDTPTYMEALSGENLEEYFKAMDDEIQSLTRRDTWEIFLKEVSCWSQCASSNMVFQVQEETWMDNQEIQGTILCKRGYPEVIVS